MALNIRYHLAPPARPIWQYEPDGLCHGVIQPKYSAFGLVKVDGVEVRRARLISRCERCGQVFSEEVKEYGTQI